MTDHLRHPVLARFGVAIAGVACGIVGGVAVFGFLYLLWRFPLPMLVIAIGVLVYLLDAHRRDEIKERDRRIAYLYEQLADASHDRTELWGMIERLTPDDEGTA